jgi:hypothetical protein
MGCMCEPPTCWRLGLGSAVLQDIQCLTRVCLTQEGVHFLDQTSFRQGSCFTSSCITPKAKISKEDLDKVGLIDTASQDGCVRVFHRLTQVNTSQGLLDSRSKTWELVRSNIYRSHKCIHMHICWRFFPNCVNMMPTYLGLDQQVSVGGCCSNWFMNPTPLNTTKSDPMRI